MTSPRPASALAMPAVDVWPAISVPAQTPVLLYSSPLTRCADCGKLSRPAHCQPRRLRDVFYPIFRFFAV